MAVVEWTEISPPTLSFDEQGYRNYTRSFKVYTDSKTTGPIEVSAAIPIVQWESYYSVGDESDPYAVAQTASINPVQGEFFIWDYVVNYSTKPFANGNMGNPLSGDSPPGLGAAPSPPGTTTPPGQQHPDERPWSLKFGTDNTQEAAPAVDRFGQNVKASNGQSYTGLQYDVAVGYIELSFDRTTCDRSKPLYYRNTTNNDIFLNYAVGTLRCIDYTIDAKNEPQWGVVYNYNLKFQYKAEGHATIVADEGTYWKDGFDVKKNQDKWSNPVDGSVLLDGAGGKLADGDAPHTHTFMFYQSTTYADII